MYMVNPRCHIHHGQGAHSKRQQGQQDNMSIQTHALWRVLVGRWKRSDHQKYQSNLRPQLIMNLNSECHVSRKTKNFLMTLE